MKDQDPETQQVGTTVRSGATATWTSTTTTTKTTMTIVSEHVVVRPAVPVQQRSGGAVVGVHSQSHSNPQVPMFGLPLTAVKQDVAPRVPMVRLPLMSVTQDVDAVREVPDSVRGEPKAMTMRETVITVGKPAVSPAREPSAMTVREAATTLRKPAAPPIQAGMITAARGNQLTRNSVVAAGGQGTVGCRRSGTTGWPSDVAVTWAEGCTVGTK
jgi:hypothetical protein